MYQATLGAGDFFGAGFFFFLTNFKHLVHNFQFECHSIWYNNRTGTMLQYLFTDPFSFAIWAAALLMAVTVHEFAHAWTADHLGDPTAKLAGRVTFNPLAHLDPIGTLMLLLFRFGWGKPVPIDPFNLRNPRRDAAIISFAGPAANLTLATILSVFIRLSYIFLGPTSILIETVLLPFVFLSVMLAIFNLIPIHPLDGGNASRVKEQEFIRILVRGCATPTSSELRPP